MEVCGDTAVSESTGELLSCGGSGEAVMSRRCWPPGRTSQWVVLNNPCYAETTGAHQSSARIYGVGAE